MKIFEAIKKHRDYHTSIVSSFTSNLSAYEDLLLHRIEQSGTYNNLLLVDKRMYQDEMALLMELQNCQRQQAFHAGQRYSLYPISVRGAFHPKIYLFLGRNKARMYLGSANVSPAGLGRNRELMFDIQCSHEDSSERRIIQQAFHFLHGFLKSQHGDTSLLQEQVDFVRRESAWIFEDAGMINDGEPFLLEDGTPASLLLSNDQPSTLQRLLELVGDDPVDQLTIISPYWDGNLQTLSTLQERLQPGQTNLLIQPKRTELPANEVKNLSGDTRLYRTFSDDSAGFMHAKMILISTPSADHLICGSANCTTAALGSLAASPLNAEASMYRRLPVGTVLSQLGLNKVISPGHLLLPEDIPEARTGDSSINQNSSSTQAAKYPGTVELEAGRIRWLPASGIQSKQAVLILFKWDFERVAELSPNEGARYALPQHINDQDLMLAQFKLADGYLTAPVFIHHKQTLRRARYKSGNSLIRSIVEKYEQGAPIGLDLLEIIQRIESETSAKSARKSTTHTGGTRGNSDETDEGEVIPYEDFVRARSTSSHIGSIGLTHAALMPVRDILNRYYQQQTEKSASESRNVLDDNHLYDEEAAAETEQSSNESAPTQELPEINQELIQEAVALQRSQIIKAIDNYSQELKARSSDVPFQAVDLLKLRLLLEIILSSSLLTEGYSIICLVPEYKHDRDTLCHLAGKVLFAFFAGSHPPVDRVDVPEGLDGYPIDYMETWACCLWTAQKLCRRAENTSELFSLMPSLSKLKVLIDKKIVRGLTQIQRDEIDELMNRMSKRYVSGNE